MAIVYPLRLPRVSGFARIEIFKASVVGTTVGPYDGSLRTYVWPGQWWEGQIVLPGLNESKSPAWEAFFGKLNGKEGSFLFSDAVRSKPRGSARANIILDGSGQPVLDSYGDYTISTALDNPVIEGSVAARSQEVPVKGLRASASGWLLAGDYVQFGSGATARLHQVLEDFSSNGSGKGTLVVWPRTREALLDGDPLVYTNAKGVFKLTDSRQGMSRRPGPLSETSFSCRELLQ